MASHIHSLRLTLAIALSAACGAASADPYLVGRGMSDITGEAAEVGMMGYASLSQVSAGIHMRQRARAFIVADQASGKRIVFVNNDLGMVFQGVQQAVLKQLRARYGSLYGPDNVILAATHTHSGSGGFSHYALYNITTYGYNKRTFDAVVGGIVAAIDKAHRDLKPGSIAIGKGQLTDASNNRSLPAYLRNPLAERERWNSPIDPDMTVLRFRQGADDVGVISWFATHGVSMTPNNHLLSSDNKGYAAWRWEHDLKGVRYNADGDFVAAFAQSNAGDMTPNLNLDGTGPTRNEFDNTRIIGERQLQKALAIYNGALEPLAGTLDYRQRFIDFSRLTVAANFADGRARSTCPAALGTAFAAGTEDGRGLDGFNEGDLAGNPFFQAIGGILTPAPQWVRDCHGVKPVLLAPGVQQPVPWSPEVLPVSIVRIGQLAIVAAPGELTIMAGRRIRETVQAALGDSVKHVVIAGYANAYSGYITTPEEYDAQHYEGASTHFGKWTLGAYQQSYHELATAMRQGVPAYPSAPTRDLSNQQLSFQTGVVLDNTPLFKSFGDVVRQANASYARGQRVDVEFWTGHPKNDLRQNGSFLEVQRWEGAAWRTVATDGDWNTIYRWVRVDPVWGSSKAAISWDIPADAAPGQYRIRHDGNYKNGWDGSIRALSGTSRTFQVN
ncbi:neutral/alkaline ceramidase [Massilia antarctica]|uniref:Neutral ceramidase n=1 Tax=Massilia antarctica TaxID=2765360 RepID=A0AA48WIE8_9BURK|nr:neutral/alkaline ceramidase [Massilia antarctica]QPI52029.1 neutral/alkaline ceramidase [Massilia antarctica]